MDTRLRRVVAHTFSVYEQHSRRAFLVHTRAQRTGRKRKKTETITGEATILFLYGASLFFLHTFPRDRAREE